MGVAEIEVGGLRYSERIVSIFISLLILLIILVDR